MRRLADLVDDLEAAEWTTSARLNEACGGSKTVRRWQNLRLQLLPSVLALAMDAGRLAFIREAAVRGPGRLNRLRVHVQLLLVRSTTFNVITHLN